MECIVVLKAKKWCCLTQTDRGALKLSAPIELIVQVKMTAYLRNFLSSMRSRERGNVNAKRSARQLRAIQVFRTHDFQSVPVHGI